MDKTSYPFSPARPAPQEYLKNYALLNAKTVAASADGAAVQLTYPGKSDIHIKVQSGDVSGTNPTLDVLIQESLNGSTGWVTIATFVQITAADQVQFQKVTKTKPYIRYSHTLGGTMSPKVNCNILVQE